MSPALRNQLKNYCRENGISMSRYVKSLIQKELKDYTPAKKFYY